MSTTKITPARTGNVVTIHKLLADVPNPYFELRDKRGRDRGLLHRPVIKAGTRIALKRDYGMNDQSPEEVKRKVEGCNASVSLEADQSYSSSTELSWTEIRPLDSDVVEVRYPGERISDEGWEGIHKKRILAKGALLKAIVANLSESLADYPATIAAADHCTETLLHRLYLLGKISLDDIRAADALPEEG